MSLIRPENGQVIASTTHSEEGSFSDDQPYFLNGKTGPYVDNPQYSSALQSIVMIASSPLLTSDGQLLGVLAARLNLESLNAVITRRTNIHETDDAYLVSTSNLFITQPRLVSDPDVLQGGVHTEDIAQCLRQESGVVEAADYRNVPSFMAYRWIPDRQLCLIVKIDQAEAYRPIRAFGWTIALISALALLAAAGLAVALARSLTRPILALQEGAARFARGELDLRLDETTHDEIGQLAAELNKMAEALTEQQTDLRLHAEQFFNLTPDMLCTVNASGRLLDLNPAWEHTLGYTRDELKGYLLTNLIHPDDHEITTSALQRVTNDVVGRFESRFRHKDGHYCWLAWVVVVSSQEQLLYAAARDVTERRSAEEKLREQTEELRRSNKELEQFAYVASHDLQEPLRLVTSYVQLLVRRYQGELDQDADEFIGFILEGANRMKSLLSDLLAYSKVGSDGKEFASVTLEETLKRAVDNLQPVIQDSRATVTHDPLPLVTGDDVQMVQLLQNLIENAIKFHGAELPRIHVGVRQMGERWLLFVRDNGIGIDPQFTERVFGIFQRLHITSQYPGTGIGLAICRKIVERHGGRIWVDSEPGKGATFYFTLQPAEAWSPSSVSPEVVKPRSKDTVADRATDLI
jgi:PAS domain S-box-containing protein